MHAGPQSLHFWGAHLAQCVHSATIWAFGRIIDPYFEILGAPRGIMVSSDYSSHVVL